MGSQLWCLTYLVSYRLPAGRPQSPVQPHPPRPPVSPSCRLAGLAHWRSSAQKTPFLVLAGIHASAIGHLCQQAPCPTCCRQGPVWRPRRSKQSSNIGPVAGVKNLVGTAGRWVLQGVLVYTAVVALQGATGRKRLKEDLEVVKVRNGCCSRWVSGGQATLTGIGRGRRVVWFPQSRSW